MRIAVVVLTIVITRTIASAQLSAEKLYEQGQAAFDDRDYRTAIALWTRSYGLSRQPLLIFNIAQARRLSGDCALALEAYRRFIAIDPSSEQRPLADEFVNELEPKCDAITPPPSIVDRVPARPGRRFKMAGLVTGGAGALSITVGLVLGHRASRLDDEVTRACSISCDWAEQKTKDAAGRRAATIGYTLDLVGVAALVGGAVMYHLGDRQRAIGVAPRPGGGAVVAWSGAW